MFQEDQGAFYRQTQGTEQLRGEIPDMEKFEEFWGGIWEDETKTPNRKWMNTVAKKIREKVKNVQEFTITEKNFYDIVKNRKNWSAPGIDGIQNFWWKKLKDPKPKMDEYCLKTPNRKWINTVAKKIREKVKNVQEFSTSFPFLTFRFTEKNFYNIVKKRKNWSVPGIDRIQNFWWKKLKGAWKSIIRCFT